MITFCELPPEGWYCTRERGHEGPCAAHPHSSTIYDMAINKWGVMPQAQMACEECGELIQAISKCFFRGKGVEKSGIVSELADVTIMIEQLTQILGVSEEVEAEKRRKQERLLNRILDQ